jgi:very-short-patch-repair endonuclease
LGKSPTHRASILDNDYIRAARGMRVNPTPAEDAVWTRLRNRQLARLKFYRQRVNGSLIADFYCAAARLVVEVDDDIHDYQKDSDSVRTRYLEDNGYHEIRFPNDAVLYNLEDVPSEISQVALKRINDFNPTPLSRKQERG